MTISDPSFPVPKAAVLHQKSKQLTVSPPHSTDHHHHQNTLPPGKKETGGKKDNNKFSPAFFIANLVAHLVNGNSGKAAKVQAENKAAEKAEEEAEIRAKSVAAELGHHLPPPQQQLSFGKFPDKEEIGSSSDSSSSSWRWWRPALQTLLEVSHFDLEELAASSWLGRLLMVVKAPIYLVFTLTIPVVDSELPEAGWNRSLALFQLLLSPQCCLLITEMTIAPFSRLQVHLVVLAGSAIVLPLVAASSSKGSAPRYHIVFAYFGFIVAISWIYTIANEVVSLLKAIGVIFNLSQFMLGLTFLAWGNSIGDFISNLTMARNGFPRMAISACFGGPVLNMLLGVGIPYTYLLLKQQQTMPSMPSIELVYSRMISIMYGTISLSLVTTIVVLVFVTKFASAKFHGFILYGLYASFLASAIFTEIKNLS